MSIGLHRSERYALDLQGPRSVAGPRVFCNGADRDHRRRRHARQPSGGAFDRAARARRRADRSHPARRRCRARLRGRRGDRDRDGGRRHRRGEGSGSSWSPVSPDVIFHLAAVVSGEAEADLEKGYRVNVDGSRRLFEAMRRSPLQQHAAGGIQLVDRCVRPAVPGRNRRRGSRRRPRPATGPEKAIVELMLDDYTRRGVLDAVSLRLPTICVRPGAPNRAASGFFSNIIREPLTARTAILPVSDDVRHWFASPRAAVDFLIHAATLPGQRARAAPVADDAGRLGDRRRCRSRRCERSRVRTRLR